MSVVRTGDLRSSLDEIKGKLDMYIAQYLDIRYPDSVFRTDSHKRKRILVSVYAYAYEFHNVSIVPDRVYDDLSRQINVTYKTGNDKMDRFFEEHFDPSTGVWIHQHPELDKLETYFRAWEKYSHGIHPKT